MKKIFLLSALLLLQGCNGNSHVHNSDLVHFHIQNDLSQEISALTVSATETVCKGLNYQEYLPAGEEAELSLDFSPTTADDCQQPTSDGEYILDLEYAESTHTYYFGYYSNGKPLDSEFYIQVQEDGVWLNGFEIPELDLPEEEINSSL